MNTSIMTTFDLIIVVMGIYMITEAYRMKKTGELSKTVVNEKEINHCKDKKGFIDFVFPKSITFGVILILFGILDFANTYMGTFGAILDIVILIVFVAGFIWFSKQLGIARKNFFGYRKK